MLLEFLATDLKLNPGVINVLIDYVLKVNNNKLTKNYVEVIASQWKRSGIKSVCEAMDMAQKEYKSKHKRGTKITKKKEPEWFNKENFSSQASNAEIAELNDLINSL